MRRRWLAVLAMAACGGRGSPDGAEPVVKPWVKAADYAQAVSEINRAVLEAFRGRGIVIPFPQREVRMLA